MGGNLSKEWSIMEGNVNESGLEIRRTEHLARAAGDPARPSSATKGWRAADCLSLAGDDRRPPIFFSISVSHHRQSHLVRQPAFSEDRNRKRNEANRLEKDLGPSASAYVT